MPHRLVRRSLSWLELHPRATNLLGMLTAALAIFGLGVTLWLHSDENHRVSVAQSQIQADQAARSAATKVLSPVVCNLIYSYVHDPKVSPEIGRAWQRVGFYLGCPGGIKP